MFLATLHSFVNLFADGYSNVKIILFFTYLPLLGILYLIFKNKDLKKISWHYFGCSILLMYLYGLCLQIFYNLSNNVPLMVQTVTGNNGNISYSSIWHIHLLKACIGIFVPYLSKVDAGGAYLGVFPNCIFLMGSALLIILLIQTIFYFVTSFKNLLTYKKNRQIVFLIIGYALLSFSLIKTSIDGGIFRSTAIISFIFLLLFIFRSKLPKYHYYISFAIGFILIIIFSFLRYGNDTLCIQSAAIILLYNLVFYLTEENINLPTVFLFTISFFMGWYFEAYREIGIYKYSNFTAPNGYVYYYDKEEKEVKKLSVVSNQKLSDLADTLDENINYLPFAIPSITCTNNVSKNDKYLTIISKIPISKNTFIYSNYINIESENSTRIKNQWETKLRVTEASCLPERLEVINKELIQNNITSYIYYGN